MKNPAEILDDISMMCIEDKIQLIDSLLNSMNSVLPDVDEFWRVEAERRIAEINSGILERA
jgi:hypothetical protein